MQFGKRQRKGILYGGLVGLGLEDAVFYLRDLLGMMQSMLEKLS